MSRRVGSRGAEQHDLRRPGAASEDEVPPLVADVSSGLVDAYA